MLSVIGLKVLGQRQVFLYAAQSPQMTNKTLKQSHNTPMLPFTPLKNGDVHLW